MDRYWPERVMFFVGMLALAVLLFLGSTGPNPVKLSDAVNALGVGIKLLLPLWFVLRAFDIAFVAHRRNRSIG